mmetsp:Transcript_24408/g.58749  ORF Transcript_24408/g.58749 Transcript_24408/m.58749 type:complete len:317 (+) Transcript_24408:383-1333(+)
MYKLWTGPSTANTRSTWGKWRVQPRHQLGPNKERSSRSSLGQRKEGCLPWAAAVARRADITAECVRLRRTLARGGRPLGAVARRTDGTAVHVCRLGALPDSVCGGDVTQWRRLGLHHAVNVADDDSDDHPQRLAGAFEVIRLPVRGDTLAVGRELLPVVENPDGVLEHDLDNLQNVAAQRRRGGLDLLDQLLGIRDARGDPIPDVLEQLADELKRADDGADLLGVEPRLEEVDDRLDVADDGGDIRDTAGEAGLQRDSLAEPEEELADLLRHVPRAGAGRADFARVVQSGALALVRHGGDAHGVLQHLLVAEDLPP